MILLKILKIFRNFNSLYNLLCRMVQVFLKLQKYLPTIILTLLNRSWQLCKRDRKNKLDNSKNQNRQHNSNFSRCRTKLNNRNLCCRKHRWILIDIK
nr:MAG TPA: hypothetical protein [Caudoviricetes sp.]